MSYVILQNTVAAMEMIFMPTSIVLLMKMAPHILILIRMDSLEAWQSTRKYISSIVGTTTTPTNKITSKSSPGLSRAALYMYKESPDLTIW